MEAVVKLFNTVNDNVWAFAIAVAGAVAAGFHYLMKRIEKKEIKFDMGDGTQVAAKFQTQQATFIEQLTKALDKSNQRHDECERNYDDCKRDHEDCKREIGALNARMRINRSQAQA